jgi:hypothetical protein
MNYTRRITDELLSTQMKAFNRLQPYYNRITAFRQQKRCLIKPAVIFYVKIEKMVDFQWKSSGSRLVAIVGPKKLEVFIKKKHNTHATAESQVWR